MLFLDVPYAEKDGAKALGARWNPTRRRWYVPDGVATEPFEKWLPKDGAGVPEKASPAAKARVDAYVGKTVIGANCVDYTHDCNPFEACPSCEAALAGSEWAKARAGLVQVIAQLGARPAAGAKGS